MLTGERTETLEVSKSYSSAESALTGGEYDLGKSVTAASTPRRFYGDKHASIDKVTKTPRGHVRYELQEARRIAMDASDRLSLAGKDGDLPALAVAANDLSEALATMWRYRDFGGKEWQQVVQVCQQALCEPDLYEDIEMTQAFALRTVVHDYISQRFTLASERKEALKVLRSGGFDVFRLLSGAS